MSPIRLALIASICLAICLAFLQTGQQGGALSRLEGQFLDLRFALRGEIDPPEDILILAIDDVALEKAQAFPLPRNIIAEAVKMASDGGARGIVLDLLLSGETGEDHVLENALGASENAALAISLTGAGSNSSPKLQQYLDRNSIPVIHNYLPNGPLGMMGPNPEFAAQALLGHVNLRLDDDGALRRFPVVLRQNDGPALPALAVVGARLQAGLGSDAVSLVSGEALILGPQRIPLDRENMAVLNYFGAGGTIQTVSISDVATADVSGKLVFIGATAEGYRDSFMSPFDTALPGVEALATLSANILDQSVLRRDQVTWVIDAVLAIVCGALSALFTSRPRVLGAVLGCGMIWGFGLGVLHLGFLNYLWLDGATLITALSMGSLLGFAARWETHRRRALNLSRYQSPQLVEILANEATPEFDGRTQQAAILFVDLADFTRRSAMIGSADTGVLLNRFHTLVNGAAKRCNGAVFFTAGDGAMIVFGLPKMAPDDCKRAIKCAQVLIAEIKADEVIGAVSHPTPVRIGAHSGEVYATVLGEEGRSTPTITGDVVNVASRLQEQAKTQGAILAMSDDIYQDAGCPDLPRVVRAGPVILRGRTQSLEIWLLHPPHSFYD